MKGITPVIALVMLMLITVGMVGMAYTWFSGMLTSYTEKTISIPPGGAFCSGSPATISVVVMNTGATSVVTQADLVLVDVDGTLIPNTNPIPRPTFTANPGEGKMVVQGYNCISACSVGPHTVRIGTRAGVVETTAICK
ncbi:MAG: hypothetical protein V1731_00935 [Candidatus Aenigmatarchaeota archaeon]